MPDLERLSDYLQRELHEHDPLKLAYLEGYRRGKWFARFQMLIVVMSFVALLVGHQLAKAADSVDQGYESTQIDQDEPDQDPVYDEMDDYDNE